MAVKPHSNRFGGLLDRLLVSRQLSLHQAGRLLGQHHSVLSSVVRGVDGLTRKNLAKLVERLEKNAKKLDMTPAEAADWAADLQVAWLEDLTLPALSDKVAVVRRRQRAPKVTDPRLKALGVLESASADSPRLAQWLIDSAALLAQNPAHGRAPFRR